MDDTAKTCGKCGEIKPLSDFRRRTSAADGLQSYCRACHNATVAEWRKQNPRVPRRTIGQQNQAGEGLMDSADEQCRVPECGTAACVRGLCRDHYNALKSRCMETRATVAKYALPPRGGYGDGDDADRQPIIDARVSGVLDLADALGMLRTESDYGWILIGNGYRIEVTSGGHIGTATRRKA